MKNKFIPILLALCMVASIIAGCSNSPDKGKASGAQAKKTFVFGDTTFNPENSESDVNPHNDCGGWACLR